MKNFISKHKKWAAMTAEMFIMTALIVFVVLSILFMFGNNIQNMIANSNFHKYIASQEQKDVNTQYKEYAQSQQLIAVTASQGITVALDRMNSALALIGKPKEELTKAQLSEIGDSILAAMMLNEQTNIYTADKELSDKIPSSEQVSQFKKSCKELYGLEVESDRRNYVLTDSNGNTLKKVQKLAHASSSDEYIKTTIERVYN